MSWCSVEDKFRVTTHQENPQPLYHSGRLQLFQYLNFQQSSLFYNFFELERKLFYLEAILVLLRTMSNSGISIGPSKGHALSIWHHRQNGSIKRQVKHEELGYFMRRKTLFFYILFGGNG
jgi:hypothetical protein